MTTAMKAPTYPLTPLQEGMLFHTRLAPAAGVYVQQIVVHLPEAVDVDAMRQAWQSVMQRHDALRTAFADTVQRVADEVELPFEEIETTDTHKFLATDRRRGFDLEVPPLFRLTLIRRGSADFVLIWTFHHALLDGRSHRLVLAAAFAAYDAIRSEREPSFAPVRPFREHVEWLHHQDTQRPKRYWRGMLADVDAPTQFPLLRSSVAGVCDPGLPASQMPATEEVLPGEQTVTLAEDLSVTLKAFAAEHDLTPTTLLHAAWAILLARYSGENDIVFGGTRRPPARTGAATGPTVGLLINTLPVRARLAADTPILDLLKQSAIAMARRARLRLRRPRRRAVVGRAAAGHASLRDDRRRRTFRTQRIASGARRDVGQAARSSCMSYRITRLH